MRCGVLLVAAVAAFAAAAPSVRDTRVRVPAWLQAETKIAAQDVKASLDGEPARVLSVQGPDEDLLLLVVLDIVGDLRYVDAAKAALKEEIAKLPDNAWVGLLRAQDGLSVLADPTPDRTALAAAIDAVPISGRAGLLDTVETAERLADSLLGKSNVRVALLYVTDSDIQNYREDFTNPVINSSDSHDLSRRFPEALVQEKIQKLAGKLAARQAPLFIVHLSYRSDTLNEAYQNGLKLLAETTAGSSAFCRSLADVPSSLREAFSAMRSHYSISVELPKRARRSFQVQMSLTGDRALSHRTRFVWRQE